MNKNNLMGKIIFSCVMLPISIYAQGTFRNLDFELARYPLIPDSRGRVPITNAMPGWTMYIGGNSYDTVRYNDVALGAPDVSFHDAGSVEVPYHGLRSIKLQASFGVIEPPISAAIGQTGLIPADAQSVAFYYVNSLGINLTFGGQPVSLYNLGPLPPVITCMPAIFRLTPDRRRSFASLFQPQVDHWITSSSPPRRSPNPAPGPCLAWAAHCSGA